MKFKVIATIIVVVFLLVLTVLFSGGSNQQTVDENANPVDTTQQSQ